MVLVESAGVIFLDFNGLLQDLIQPGLGQDTCFFSSYLAHVVYFHGKQPFYLMIKIPHQIYIVVFLKQFSGIIALLLLGNLTLFLFSAYSLLFGIWAGSG